MKTIHKIMMIAIITLTIVVAGCIIMGWRYIPQSQERTTFTILYKDDSTQQILTTNHETLIFSQNANSFVELKHMWGSLAIGKTYNCESNYVANVWLGGHFGSNTITNCVEVA